MQCANCGHQSSPGATFCLNCGTQQAVRAAVTPARGPSGTQAGVTGLPNKAQIQRATNKNCAHCQADNAYNMKFCRQCGVAFATPPQGVPQGISKDPSGGLPGMARQESSAPSRISAAPVSAAPSAPIPAARSRPASPTPPPGSYSGAVSSQRASSQPVFAVQQCPICQGETPGGFSFCQRCGKPLPKINAVVEPPRAVVGHAARATPSKPEALPKAAAQKVSPMAPDTIADSLVKPSWGALVSVKRDGSDGDIHVLTGDYCEVGKSTSCSLVFDDPFIAPCHARLERNEQGVRLVPLDSLNGVFLRLRKETKVWDGALVLLGRELLRFEMLREQEKQEAELVQHGVCLFGSPQRKAWGRVMQQLPNGGIGDVRYLYGEEMVVGREDGQLLYNDDEFLSRRHAAFRRKGSDCTLVDLDSSNGTFLRLKEPQLLVAGDFLRIGDQMFRYEKAK